MRMRLIGYLLMTAILLAAAALAPRAWATPAQTRPGQTVPTLTPKGQPTPATATPPTRPPAEPTSTPVPGVPSPTPGQATPTLTPSVDAAGLLFVKEIGRRQVWPGATVRYTLTLTNRGDSSARQIVITDPLPAELEPGEIESGAARWDGRTVRAEALILPPGGRLTITFTAIVRNDVASGRTVVNRASASAADGVLLNAAATAILPPAELPPTGGIADCGFAHLSF